MASVMIEQLKSAAAIGPAALLGRPDDPDFGLEEFVMLSPNQQRECMDKHVAVITVALEEIRNTFSAEERVVLEELCVQALEWIDPDRFPHSAFGGCSVDLRMLFRLCKYAPDGTVTMSTEWFTAYTIALGSNMEDPVTAMGASDLFATVEDGGNVLSKKLNKVLDEAPKHFAHQGLGKHADLSKHDKVLVGNRIVLLWAPSEEQAAQGWVVETKFSSYCYQDNGRTAALNGPLSWGALFGPKGGSIFSGYPGQNDMTYKMVDEETGHLMEHMTKVTPSDRKVELDGGVREQTEAEKIAVLSNDSSRAVQIRIGVKGTPPASNREIILFGQQKPQPTVDMSGCRISETAIPWTTRKMLLTDMEKEQERIAEEEREAKKKAEAERMKAAAEERHRLLLERIRLQEVKDLKESMANAAARPYFFVYYREWLLSQCIKYNELKDFSSWIVEGDAALDKARAHKSNMMHAMTDEDFEMVGPLRLTEPDPDDDDAIPTGPYYRECEEAQRVMVTDEELADFKYDDLEGTKYKVCIVVQYPACLNDDNIASLEAHRRSILEIVKQGKDPEEASSWCSSSYSDGLRGGLSGCYYRSLGVSSGADDDDAPVMRSMCADGLANAPPRGRTILPVMPEVFDEAEVVEAELGLAPKAGRALAPSVANPESFGHIRATIYERYLLPFGTVPAKDYLIGIVNALLKMRLACEQPTDGKKGPKTSEGFVASRHSEKAIRSFGPGTAPDMEDIASGMGNYRKNAKDLIPKEDTDSDEDNTPLGKVQKLKVEHTSPSSPMHSDDE
jgi:hypothetical protein